MVNLAELTVWKTTPYEKDGLMVSLDLYSATVSELGQNTTAGIVKCLAESGFGGRIPKEAKDALKTFVDDEPVGTILVVIDGEPDSYGILSVLRVGRDSGGSWVAWDDAFPDSVWYAVFRLVFCRK